MDCWFLTPLALDLTELLFTEQRLYIENKIFSYYSHLYDYSITPNVAGYMLGRLVPRGLLHTCMAWLEIRLRIFYVLVQLVPRVTNCSGEHNFNQLAPPNNGVKSMAISAVLLVSLLT